jgi:multidrug resistance efflux pump
MTNTELLQEPELTPILEAYFETRDAQNKALDACSWSMSLDRSWSYDIHQAETTADNIAKMTKRREQLAEALILVSRFADFVALGIDEVAADYDRASWDYRQQQRDIADAPRRAWAMAYNARLAEIDKQIKSAKIRKSRTWSKWRKDGISYEQANIITSAIELEIDHLEKRRDVAAAETFESVAA